MDSSDFWKLDKIDKIGIALIFIVFALYSTFSCFASEPVDVSTLENLSVNLNAQSIVTSTGTLGYIEIVPGYIYHFKNTLSSNIKVCCFSNDFPHDGLSVDAFSVSAGETFDFTYTTFDYMYFNFSSGSGGFELTRELNNGMEGSVGLLYENVGFNLWESFTNSLSFALPVVLVCFGIYIICLFIKKFSKGV